MKYLEREVLSKKDLKENVLYLFGENKRAWLGYVSGEYLFSVQALNTNKTNKTKLTDVSLLLETEYNKDEFEEAYVKYSKDFFTDYKKSLLDKRVNYTSLLLDKDSHLKLVDKLKHVIPSKWNIVAHHMTLTLGELEKELENDLLGKTFEVKVLSYSVDLDIGVMAVKVEAELETRSLYKHVTVALKEGSSAMLSNNLTDFNHVDTFTLTGVVSYSLNDQSIVN